MGCWNGTCALTNLPIREGEEVYLYILKKNDYFKLESVGGGICYPTEIAHPHTLPLLGTYNDYGAVENIKNDSLTKAVLKSLNYDKSILQLQNDMHENHRGDENAKACKVTPFRKFCYVIMHKWAVEKCWELFDTHRKNFSWNKDPFTWEMAETHITRDNEDGGLSFEFLNEIGIEKGFRLTKSLTQNKTVKYKEEIMNHVKLCVIMSLLRRTWFPCSGAGSQDQTYEVHRDMFKASFDFTKKRMKQDKYDAGN